jgi:hypothetical protein
LFYVLCQKAAHPEDQNAVDQSNCN